MELTRRLERIASHVPLGTIVADVGTDHGYIPIYLVKEGVSPKAYAIDVAKGPLKKAEMNIEANGVKELVVPILSDGLHQLGDRKVDTLIIAGMGGMLIKRILVEAKHQLKKIPTLILSPHLDIAVVRKVVHKLGYEITLEDFIREGQQFYPIILCNHGKEKYENEVEYKYGKKLIESCHMEYREYLQVLIMKNIELKKELLKKNTPASIKRIDEIEKDSEAICEVGKWLK
ncbi:MAG: hypothetical protein CVU84_05160 [Firmicutes bacterium HGW-Firmicutes-1]|jgi:tRNA (adenine22-N1)-methyltransferase|nr:MAG: hypothetical protein CVU84_05160 [Firmicutes bacterium HGW-Firmicutes-1]